MATTADFRNGMVIDFQDDLYEIIEFLHVKPGKGGAFVRTKLKNLRIGAVLNNTFRAGEKVEEVRVEKKKMEYLYSDGNLYVMMDPETYQQTEVDGDLLGDKRFFLKENTQLTILEAREEIIGVELPTTVDLKVTDCEPGVKGNTVSGGTKNATLETGLTIQVPMFIDRDDIVKVDTRTGEYIERVST
jgi:elongation factor P